MEDKGNKVQNKYQLTIAIPTYNRSEKLKNTLERVLNYIEGLAVELLVSDNASTDDTFLIVQELKKNSNISYYRNEENLGFDGNFLNCLSNAKGEYIWLLGDDDIVLENAVESVLEALELKPVCLHLNTCMIIDEDKEVFGEGRFDENGVLCYRDGNEFIKDIGIYVTFLSSLVFRNDLVKKVDNMLQYCGTNFLQSHVFLELLKNKGCYCIVTQKCVAELGNRTVNYDLLETWLKNYGDLLMVTAVNAGLKESYMREVLYKSYKETIYSFVVFYRQTCENQKYWNRKTIWNYIDMFPDLKSKFQFAIYLPVFLLRFLK